MDTERIDPEIHHGHWEQNELYEKQRVRLRRRWFGLVSLVFVLFLVLCAVPVVQERAPKWGSLRAARQLAVQLEQLKTVAIQKKEPVRLSIRADGQLVLSTVEKCSDSNSKEILRDQTWAPLVRDLRVLSSEEAEKLDIRSAVQAFCFDPILGANEVFQKRVIVIVPVKDLTEDLTGSRMDRASFVVIEGSSAKISIN